MPILTQDFPGAPGGMNVALPQQELDDTEARYIQDALLDFPGLVRRRGPVQAEAGVATLPRPASGLVVTMNPAGDDRYAALTGTGANGYLTAFSDDRSATVDLTWPHPLPTDPAGSDSTRYRLVDSKPAVGGGNWIGVSSDYGADSPNEGLALWRGGNKADYSTGTVSLTRGSATVTGSGTSWLANVVPGMFLFSDTTDPYTATYIGTVLAVNSNTEIVLEKASPYAGSAEPYTLTSLRGFMPRVAKGKITAATDSTTVSGGSTKFNSQGLGSGSWNLYRASDFGWIGKVASVQSDISLTLSANAALAMADDQYIALRADWGTTDKSVDITASTNKVGWLNAVYAERNWYANNGAQFDKTYRLWFSDTSDPEAVDLSNDGDWIPIGSTADTPEPIRALMPTYNALLVLKENEAFAVYGSSPSSFSSKKLEDDGTISTMSVQSFGGGAIWAGREGIHYYDGVQVTNLMAGKFGDVWRNSIRSLENLRYRAWSMMARNHYFLFIERLSPTISVVKGNTSSTPTHWVVAINMDTRAVTLHTNIGIRGAITLPAQAGRSVWFVANRDAPNMVANPSFETDTTGWNVYEWPSAEGGTIEVSTDVAKFGTKSLKVTPGKRDGNRGVQSWPTSYPTTVGETYTMSAWVYLPANHAIFTGEPVQLRIGDANSPLQVSYYGADDLTAGWNRISTTFVATATSHYFYVNLTWLDTGGLTGTLVFYLDGMQMENGSSATAYYEGNNSTVAHIVDAATLFDDEGIDTFRSVPGGEIGPDFFFESKKFNAGDDVRLKRFKQLAVHYLAQGGALKIDTVLGLNNVGQTLTSSFPASVYTWDTLRTALTTWDAVSSQFATWADVISGVFQARRVRFLKKSHHMSFRLWQENDEMSRVRVGPYEIGFKYMRSGRV